MVCKDVRINCDCRNCIPFRNGGTFLNIKMILVSLISLISIVIPSIKVDYLFIVLLKLIAINLSKDKRILSLKGFDINSLLNLNRAKLYNIAGILIITLVFYYLGNYPLTLEYGVPFLFFPYLVSLFY